MTEISKEKKTDQAFIDKSGNPINTAQITFFCQPVPATVKEQPGDLKQKDLITNRQTERPKTQNHSEQRILQQPQQKKCFSPEQLLKIDIALAKKWIDVLENGDQCDAVGMKNAYKEAKTKIADICKIDPQKAKVVSEKLREVADGIIDFFERNHDNDHWLLDVLRD